MRVVFGHSVASQTPDVVLMNPNEDFRSTPAPAAAATPDKMIFSRFVGAVHGSVLCRQEPKRDWLKLLTDKV